MTQNALVKTVALPLVATSTEDFVLAITQSLGLPREILASSQDIGVAWRQLPALLNKIPAQLRGPLLARMCVAVSVGLTDSALNYAWNSAVLELRDKVRRFGLTIVPEITGNLFDEQKLINLQDAGLLTLCLDLNLITEEGYFMLDQCRDIRNNFSAAHPTIGQVDAYEFLNFLNRCAKFALSDLVNPKGVDTKAFIKAVKGPKFEVIQKGAWTSKLKATHEAQLETLLLTLHGIYCDPSISEKSRLNALGLAEEFAPTFTASTKSQMIDRHSSYKQSGDQGRHTASQRFFGLLSLLDLLDDTEKHSLISNAAKRLMAVHQAYDNFYNEQSFCIGYVDFSVSANLPTPLAAMASLDLQGQKPHDAAIGTSHKVTLTGPTTAFTLKAVNDEDGMDRKALPDGLYDADVLVGPRWDENKAIASLSKTLEAKKTVQLRSGKSRVSVERTDVLQQWIIDNVPSDAPWSEPLYVAKLGPYQKSASSLSSLHDAYYFPDADMTLIVNRVQQEVSTWRVDPANR